MSLILVPFLLELPCVSTGFGSGISYATAEDFVFVMIVTLCLFCRASSVMAGTPWEAQDIPEFFQPCAAPHFEVNIKCFSSNKQNFQVFLRFTEIRKR